MRGEVEGGMEELKKKVYCRVNLPTIFVIMDLFFVLCSIHYSYMKGMRVCVLSTVMYVRTLALCLIIIARPQSISCFFERASLNCFALYVCVYMFKKNVCIHHVHE